METRVEFNSEGETLVGTLFRPDGVEGPLPTVIAAGGWCYTKEIVIPHVARISGAQGIQFLGFDYRGFGESSGEPRQHLDPWMQIRDFRNAITFAERLDEVDENNLGVFGISYSGGHSLILAAIEPRVKAFVSVVPVVDGHANMVRSHGEPAFRDYEADVLEDLRNRYDGERGTTPMSTANAPQEHAVWPYGRVGEVFNQLKATEAPLHEHWNTTESNELLLNYSVFPFLPRILNKAVLMIVAEDDNITLWDLEIDAFRKIPSPKKSLEILSNISHMSIYSERRDTNIAAGLAADWFEKHLGA
jgi:pimeloyl-ACP methyl ester carboxylesterase